ncbi:MAG: glycosyltransferase family 2 protein [Candidatus Omnitrophota bacterium]
MASPYFSIIIPFYNKEKSLDTCLRSLALQDFPKDNYEVICVDNNSTDGSAAIVKKYGNIKIIEEKIQNVYAARNTGIGNSSGSTVVFTDADVEVPVDWLSNIYSAMQKNKYDILIGWYWPARPIRLLQIHSLLLCERIKKAVKDKDTSMVTAGAICLIIKKEIFLKEGLFFDNSNSEDMYFTIRCMSAGYNVGFEEKIAVKRNDIDSIGIFVLKNFIYGCSNALDIKDRLLFSGKLKYMFITVKFMFKYFPVGMGLLLFTFSFFSGYVLSKTRILSPQDLSRLVQRYTRFISKNAV